MDEWPNGCVMRSHRPFDAAGTNSGSLKTYYFAHLHGLDEASALRLFCEHYQARGAYNNPASLFEGVRRLGIWFFFHTECVYECVDG